MPPRSSRIFEFLLPIIWKNSLETGLANTVFESTDNGESAFDGSQATHSMLMLLIIIEVNI